MIPRRIFVVSLTIAISVLGDATLYTVLPVYAEEFGIRIAFVGVILSVNRFVRLLTNSWAGMVYDRFQSFWPFVIALVVGSLTTLMYGLPWGIGVFLLARMLWGTCWSFLRLEGYTTVIREADLSNRGRLMGVYKSIVNSGIMGGGFLGGLLTETLGYRTCLAIFAALTLLSAALIVWVRWRNGRYPTRVRRGTAQVSQDLELSPILLGPSDETGPNLQSPPPYWFLYLAGFTNVLVNGGVLGSTLGRLLRLRFGLTVSLRNLSIGIASVTGGLGIIRWFVSFVMAPILGHGTDRLGRRLLLALGIGIGMVAWLGLVMLRHFLWLSLAVIGISLARTAVAVSLDASIADLSHERRVGQLVSRYVTFMDLGSACGPLISYLLMGVQWKLEWVYLGGLGLLGLLLLTLLTPGVPIRRRF